jgi:hypothetical protein
MKKLHFREKQQKWRILAKNESVAFQRKITEIKNLSWKWKYCISEKNNKNGEFQLKMKILHFREKQQIWRTAAETKCRETPKNEEF